MILYYKTADYSEIRGNRSAARDKASQQTPDSPTSRQPTALEKESKTM